MLGERLKQLRQDRGLTQEAVAEQIGLTRQAVSGYEAGRTEPDLTTLMKLAEIYGVSVEDLLADNGQTEKRERTARRLALASLAVMLLCGTAQAVLRWVANRYFSVPEGVLTPERKAVFETRRSILTAAEGLEAAMLLLAPLLCAVFVVQLMRLHRARAAKLHRGVLLGAVGITALTTVPWAAADPVYRFWDYGAAPVGTLVRILLLLGIGWLADRVARGKKT